MKRNTIKQNDQLDARKNDKSKIKSRVKNQPKNNALNNVNSACETATECVQNNRNNNGETRQKKNFNPLAKYASKVGKTRISVDGTNGVRAVSSISKLYRIDDIVITKDGVEFCVSSKHCDKIIAMLRNLCYDYNIIGQKGAFPHLILGLSRVGLLIGLAIVVSFCAIYPSFITQIEVGCIGGVLDDNLSARIDEVLFAHDIRKGVRIRNDGLYDAQTDLLKMDDISFASVKRNGTHIYVMVKRVQDSALVDIVGSGVYARKRATITRVIVESGTAVKKYGDIVEPGDMIIDGFVMYGDDKIPVQASGYAYGKVYYNKSVYFADTMLKTVYGDKKTVSKLSMFGKVPSMPPQPFERCECKIATQQFGFFVPFVIYTYTFLQIDVVECQNTYTVEQMQSIVYSQIVEEFEQDAVVCDIIYDVNKTEGGTFVSVTVEAEERV